MESGVDQVTFWLCPDVAEAKEGTSSSVDEVEAVRRLKDEDWYGQML